MQKKKFSVCEIFSLKLTKNIVRISIIMPNEIGVICVPSYDLSVFLQAGGLLACGIVNCGVRSDCDPALALLGDYVQHNSMIMRIGAVVG